MAAGSLQVSLRRIDTGHVRAHLSQRFRQYTCPTGYIQHVAARRDIGEGEKWSRQMFAPAPHESLVSARIGPSLSYLPGFHDLPFPLIKYRLYHGYAGLIFGAGLQPGLLGQKQIDFLEETSSGRFVLQEEMIPPWKRYERSTGNPGRHLTARIDRDHEIATHMRGERRHLHLREQFAHIEISDDLPMPLQLSERAFLVRAHETRRL
jgi:hypothetical protein